MEETISMKLENKFYLEAVDNGPNGYPLGNQTRIYLRNNHLQYAITWFLIALSLSWCFYFCKHKKKIMNYSSTRGQDNNVSFIDAMLNGLAKDGGLYVPKKLQNFQNRN